MITYNGHLLLCGTWNYQFATLYQFTVYANVPTTSIATLFRLLSSVGHFCRLTPTILAYLSEDRRLAIVVNRIGQLSSSSASSRDGHWHALRTQSRLGDRSFAVSLSPVHGFRTVLCAFQMSWNSENSNDC